ncbi:MAG TPA: 16S rRNA (cytosine(1402)-N(4))-methyltransferase RsmH [Vicinamibacterales bacterium]|jgi:16S rRNA (cytosine1402-N4)-methyltransferase|nr:16S rRNA (cytosine(1402)-N(4))-methyltransferase RsmH [Vicinamibacterales bacterium]
MEPIHEPVLLNEAIDVLDPSRGGIFVDSTVGLGGHARAILEAGATRLLGLDRDQSALDIAAQTLTPWQDRVELIHADYRELPTVLAARGIDGLDGVLADLGVSSMQFDAPGRGFSFRRDEPLDMRMDQTSGPTAAQLLGDVDESDLADVIYRYGEERFSRRIARRIVETRRTTPIATTTQLADIVRRALPRKGYQRIDPATRTFQALRIWVNRELDGLDLFLLAAARLLRRGARFAVITFHSLEDRVVKHTFRALTAGEEAVRLLTKKPLVPDDSELARNPRARSAKLRAIERLV